MVLTFIAPASLLQNGLAVPKIDSVLPVVMRDPFQRDRNTALRLGHDDKDETNTNAHHSYKIEFKIETRIIELLSISAVSIISLVSSLGTVWSEYSVILTGCGPTQLSDVLERSCYIGTLFIAGLSLFIRIVTGKGIAHSILQFEGEMKLEDDKSFILLVEIVEALSLFAALMAFVTLGFQTYKGERMDGLSGIDVDMCRAIQQNHDLHANKVTIF